ncbi:MAG: MtnX-like HAD-IB family phosphatase [Chloroflexota bacterium]
MKTLVQCDFDGTITFRDASFLLLDTFADGDWRALLDEYLAGRISVGAFNTRAFAMVKAGREAQLELLLKSENLRIRPGFPELVRFCRENDLKFAIVSNGQDFYIKAILDKLGLTDLEYHAARASFHPEGMVVHYIGPDGNIVEDSFKETYTRLYLSQGYRVIYVGNGVSDIHPARLAQHVFATGSLLRKCRETSLECEPFEDLHDVREGIARLAAAPEPG